MKNIKYKEIERRRDKDIKKKIKENKTNTRTIYTKETRKASVRVEREREKIRNIYKIIKGEGITERKKEKKEKWQKKRDVESEYRKGEKKWVRIYNRKKN